MKPDASTSGRGGGFFLHVMPAVLYAFAVFCGSSLPAASLPNVPYLDKLVHFLTFAGMQLVSFRAVRYELPQLALKWQVFGAAVIASVLGAALELYQAVLPRRTPELLDWVADTLGAAVAAAILLAFIHGSTQRDTGAEVVQRDSKPLKG